MGNMPFELYGRALVEGGVKLLFRCMTCGEQAHLVLKDDDALDSRYPVACPCGAEVNMFFGSPKVGQILVKSLKNLREPEDAYHRCQSPLLN
jgi:hypothetical protein